MEAAGPAVLAALVIAAGTALQATVGFGLALVAAPVLVLIDPVFVPGPVIASALVLTLRMVWREWSALDWRGSARRSRGACSGRRRRLAGGRALGGRLRPALRRARALRGGSLPGAPPDRAHPAHGLPRRAALGLHGHGVLDRGAAPGARLPERQRRAAARDAGRPVRDGLRLLPDRAGVGRPLREQELLRSLLLVPGVPLGLWLSRPLLRRLEGRSVRPLVLGLSSVAAGVVLLRALL